ncbi:MAG: isoleucine--tRNA ligase [Clostridia bacterium]|nr:isoleucine--tRNA ligase [Clostridia bacterium]
MESADEAAMVDGCVNEKWHHAVHEAIEEAARFPQFKDMHVGMAAFNDECREIVSSNNEAWREYIEEMARWVDYDHAYKTMTPQFMESVMWAFKTCYDKGLIYSGYRVTPYCMHCETSLSISDTRESDSTRPRQDRWIIAKFRSETEPELEGKPVYYLAWTTTPWTLPSNLALSVNEGLTYAYVDVGEQIYVACENTLANFKNVFGEDPQIIKRVQGKDMLGIRYEPLFPYFADLKEQGCFRVVAADYVDAAEGVGIVHTAPAFGEDDYWTCRKNNIPTDIVNPVDAKGRFTEEITDFYEDSKTRNVIEMNPIIIRFLYANDKAVADGSLVHNYPHCWRCKEPLIYKAMSAWYFDIEKIKPQLIEQNEKINWVPDTVKHGRFGNWLENARDWNISRNRYWSTPIPIWECDHCHERKVLGSIAEIKEVSGIELTDLHRQYMDQVTFPCHCGGTMRRVPEVLDCWFESGSVTYAQKHYPFENKDWFETHFPCDFIVEYTGQIRCWFYYMHVMAVALFGRPAFKNCVVHGTLLAKDGKKLSKSSKNYTDPMELMRGYGTDAFRLYLYQSNAMLMGDLKFDDDGLKDAYQQLVAPLWNAANFFISYANVDGYHPESLRAPKTDHQLDRWILAKLQQTEKTIREAMDAYQVDGYVTPLVSLMDGLTNWYIRRSRRRFWGSEMTEDKQAAYDTLYYVLVNLIKLYAPVAPILSEKLYRNLTGEESVHLADWPSIPESFADDKLIADVELVRRVIRLTRSIREKQKVKNRQPLSLMQIALNDAAGAQVVSSFADIIKEELNVKDLEILDDVDHIATVTYKPCFPVIGQKYPQQRPAIIKAIQSGKFALEAGKAVLDLNGEKQAFDEDILLVTYNAKAGMHVVSESGVVVSLDLTITDELRKEGLARDIVRTIQDARKAQNYNITDRITISVPNGRLPEGWVEYICGETLGSIGDVPAPDAVLTVEGEGKEDITIAIARQ